MTHGFDKDYWESHWQDARERGAGPEIPPNPYLADETGSLVPGTALDAGCGEGSEALWLAAQGWQVSGADISSEALLRASERAAEAGLSDRLRWIEADLSTWQPDTRFDLVTTHYAHPAMAQLAFYERISDWVAPGGTLLIVGHLHSPDTSQDHGHGHPPEEASVTAASITASLDPALWDVVTAAEQARSLSDRAGGAVQLHDVVVRATRRT